MLGVLAVAVVVFSSMTMTAAPFPHSRFPRSAPHYSQSGINASEEGEKLLKLGKIIEGEITDHPGPLHCPCPAYSKISFWNILTSSFYMYVHMKETTWDRLRYSHIPVGVRSSQAGCNLAQVISLMSYC